MSELVNSEDPPRNVKPIVPSVNVPYDPQVFTKHDRTHWVGARVYLPHEDPARQFDGLITAATEDQVTVQAVVANVGMQTFIIPATCIVYMYVGAKR